MVVATVGVPASLVVGPVFVNVLLVVDTVGVVVVASTGVVVAVDSQAVVVFGAFLFVVGAAFDVDGAAVVVVDVEKLAAIKGVVEGVFAKEIGLVVVTLNRNI